MDKSFNKPLDYSKLDYGLSGSEYYRRFGKYYDGLDKLRKEEHEKEKKAEVKKKQSKETRRSAIKYILIYSIAFIGLILAIAIIGQSFDKAGMGGIFRLFFPGE